MKEVILKSDIAKVIRAEIKILREKWLPDEMYRGGALDALQGIYNKLIYRTSLDLKGGEKMAIASKKEVLELYTRIIRGETVDGVTLQAAKALARHYGIDSPGNDPADNSDAVVIVDHIAPWNCEILFDKAVSAVEDGAANYGGADHEALTHYLNGVRDLSEIFKNFLKNYPDEPED